MRLHKKRRGQVVVFYALMIPILLFAGGVGLDLGWYYLNVSRLQNAADASVIAGAKALAADTTNFKNYKYKNIVDKFPADLPDTDADTTAGDVAAAKYALKNLSSDAVAVHNGDVYTMKDNYTRGDPTIILKPSLYKDINNNYYYVVHLSEDIHHFFLGFLDDMYAGVVAVARLDYKIPPRPPGAGAEVPVDGTDILSKMYKVEDVSVMRNWEFQTNAPEEWYERFTKGQKKYSGNATEYQDKEGVHYKKGNYYRTESAEVYSGSTNQGSSNNRYNFGWNETDSLNLDFRQDVKGVHFTKDWDIGYTAPDGLEATRNKGYGRNDDAFNYRVHATFNFGKPYEVRIEDNSKDVSYDKYKKTYNNQTYYDFKYKKIEDNPQDALYVRIESEPIWDLEFKPNHNEFNSVRQIFLNINQSNMEKILVQKRDDAGNLLYLDDEKEKPILEERYKYRPLVIFYDGPEKINPNSIVRDSQPLILNLNADTRVILFAPNSPVVINGNGHKMQGFVIAREFVRLKTADDYTRTADGKYLDSKGKEYFFKTDDNLFIDESGNVQTKPLTESDMRAPNSSETPLNTYEDLQKKYELFDEDEEKVYLMHTAFNIDTSDENHTTSYYDSFELPSLKRNVYTYLDNYYTNLDDDPDNNKDNSVDMFFTKLRSSWVD
ncbi:MAG: Tad domain-containing protein [Selenomonadaceae bacterium]|nr:Tad domain-containing protein [Selenomonadaceae bacterium]